MHTYQHLGSKLYSTKVVLKTDATCSLDIENENKVIKHEISLMESAKDKANKPSDNVLTPEQKPSPVIGTLITIGVLTVGLLFASLYFGILNL